MVIHSSTHFYINWAKARLDEMDTILTSLEGKASVVQADARHMATALSLICAKAVTASGTPSGSRQKLARPSGLAERQN